MKFKKQFKIKRIITTKKEVVDWDYEDGIFKVYYSDDTIVNHTTIEEVAEKVGPFLVKIYSERMVYGVRISPKRHEIRSNNSVVYHWRRKYNKEDHRECLDVYFQESWNNHINDDSDEMEILKKRVLGIEMQGDWAVEELMRHQREDHDQTDYKKNEK